MMLSKQWTPGWWVAVFFAVLGTLVGVASSAALASAPQGEIDVSPEATPEIRQVKPNQAAAGEVVTIVISGQNFSRGAYVSFSTPTIDVISARRVNATELEAKVAVGKRASAGTVSLYVSNPASVVAEAAFGISGGAAPATAPPAFTAAAPAAAAPTTEIQPSEFGTPEVAAVEPARVARGAQVSVKITGKNFAPKAKVAFSNPGIRVLDVQVGKPAELVTRIQVASDAPSGTAGLFVVNPDDRETEVAFSVTEETAPAVAPLPTAAPAEPPTSAAPTLAAGTAPATAAPAAAETLRFDVMGLGDVTSLLQTRNLPKGTLTFGGGRLRYEEAGKEVFAASVADIKEIGMNTILGVNTGTFHVILSSGKTFNFAAASFRPADGQAIADSLRKALK
jgi:predicted Fe-Mo cluster-binding NifX family protein/predicted RNA-binding protein YlxR (DUF448 family)